MAGADFFDIKVTGRRSHGARPHESLDPIVAATALVQALQSVVSRNLDPLEGAVVSVTQFHSGVAYNVIPGDAVISGTSRMFYDAVRQQIRERIHELAAGIAAAYGVEVEVDIRDIFGVLENDERLSEEFVRLAETVVGADNIIVGDVPVTGSEDFADMLRAVPGAYFTIGHEGTAMLHNAAFTFDDSILPLGSTLLARIVQSRAVA